MGEKVHKGGRAANYPLHPIEPEKSDRLNQLLTSELLKAYGTEKLQLSYLAKLIELTSNGHCLFSWFETTAFKAATSVQSYV